MAPACRPSARDVRASEVWELRNASDNQHVLHVHGLSFTVLSRDGSPPPVHSAGLKDSVLLPSGTTTLIALRFGTDADRRAPYMFDCHVLAHEDHGMMGQFTVAGIARSAR